MVINTQGYMVLYNCICDTKGKALRGDLQHEFEVLNLFLQK